MKFFTNWRNKHSAIYCHKYGDYVCESKFCNCQCKKCSSGEEVIVVFQPKKIDKKLEKRFIDTLSKENVKYLSVQDAIYVNRLNELKEYIQTLLGE